jgi:hypothetical protein
VTLWRARPLPLPAGFVAFGLGFLLLTGVLGLGFAFTFALPRPPGFLLALTGGGLSLHIAAGLGGWFTLTVMGVSYRLLSMFMLAPDEPRRSTYAALILTVTGLVLLIAAGLSGIWAGIALGWVKAIGVALAGLSAVFYLADIVQFYRTRNRRRLEIEQRNGGGGTQPDYPGARDWCAGGGVGRTRSLCRCDRLSVCFRRPDRAWS